MENEEIEAMSQAQRMAQLEAQVAQLTKLLQMQMGTKPVAVSATDHFGDKIKIVHLMEMAPGLTTRIDLSNLSIVMSKMGEERVLSVQQFEELVGKYRSWFREGILTVSSESEEYAQHYGLDTDKKLPIKCDFLDQLGDISMSKLEDIYGRLPHGVQDSILSLWQRKCRAGDPKFKDIRKLETLNRLSDGAFTQLISEVNAQNRNNK